MYWTRDTAVACQHVGITSRTRTSRRRRSTSVIFVDQAADFGPSMTTQCSRPKWSYLYSVCSIYCALAFRSNIHRSQGSLLRMLPDLPSLLVLPWYYWVLAHAPQALLLKAGVKPVAVSDSRNVVACHCALSTEALFLFCELCIDCRKANGRPLRQSRLRMRLAEGLLMGW